MQAAMMAKRPMVSIVEDDDAVRRSLRFSLDVDGFAVRDFADAGELLGCEGWRDSSCLVIDYNLPDMTGLELVGALREQAVATPAILLASQPSESLRASAVAVGARIVEKPLFGDALVETIGALLRPEASHTI